MIFIPGHSNRWGEAEGELLQVLSDGRPHRVTEFFQSEHSPTNPNSYESAYETVRRIRRKLEGSGYGVVTTRKRRQSYWQLVRYISQDDL